MFIKRLDNISHQLGSGVSLLIIVMCLMVMYEVWMRYLFSMPTKWAHDSSGWLQVVYIMLGGGYTLLHGGFVRVDIFYRRFPLKLKAFIDLTFATVLFVIFCVFLTLTGLDVARDSIKMLEITSTGLWDGPVWPFRLMVPIGGILLLMQWIPKFVRDIAIMRFGAVPDEMRPEIEEVADLHG